MAKKKKKRSKDYLEKMKELMGEISGSDIDKLVDILWRAHLDDKTIYIIGNGGSASTATHLAADIAKNTLNNHWNDKEKRIKALSLTDNVAWMTAVANDQSHENIFVEQLKNFAEQGDVLFVISGSGNSPNVVKSAVWAKQKEMEIVGLLGFDGGYLKDFLEFSITVPSKDYGLIESVHSFIHHAIANSLMARMKASKNGK